MAEETIVINVRGWRPQPGGSKTAYATPNRNWKPGMPMATRYIHDSQGRPIVNTVDANNSKVKPWKKCVAAAAQAQYSGPLLDCPMIVEMTFHLGRIKGHYGTGKNSKLLRAGAPLYPTTKPDLLKLARPTEDALTGIVWTDDTRTVDLILRERYIDGYALEGDAREGVEIRITPHEYATIGDAIEGAQGSLIAA